MAPLSPHISFAPEPSHGACVGAGAARLTVLLGDARDASEPWHRQAVGMLEARGVRTVVPATGRDALERLERAMLGDGPRIHVAVLEQAMHDMTGLQVLRRLRERVADKRDAADAPGPAASPASQAQPDPAFPPAILLAAGGGRGRGEAGGLTSGLMSDALMIRVFSVLPHPVDADRLLATLARALARHYAGRWPVDAGHTHDASAS